MSHKRLLTAGAIIALVVIAGFVISVPHTRDLGIKPAAAEDPIVPPVTLHDYYKKGVHTISGSIEVPNACTPVSVTATLSGSASSTQSILIAISSQNDSGICLQVPTRVLFKTMLTAPAALPIRATVNGAVATTTSS